MAVAMSGLLVNTYRPPGTAISGCRVGGPRRPVAGLGSQHTGRRRGADASGGPSRQIGRLVPQAFRQRGWPAPAQQAAKVRSLDGDAANRTIGKHIDGAPVATDAAHDVIKLMARARLWDDVGFHDLLAVREGPNFGAHIEPLPRIIIEAIDV